MATNFSGGGSWSTRREPPTSEYGVSEILLMNGRTKKSKNEIGFDKNLLKETLEIIMVINILS
jgi:hypothetical protein